MKTLSLVLLCAAMLGCASSVSEHSAAEEISWKLDRINDTYAATGQMYKCTDEILRLGHEGPECIKACDMFRDVREKELKAPEWVHWEQKGTLDSIEDGKVCVSARKGTKQ